MSWFKKGTANKSKNMGQKNPNEFPSSYAREQYQAGWHHQKKKEQEKRKK
uniref:Uncharacterized protein n=1 Tax=Candidatus Kentrum sp. FW TaxID=2126338 RepID=A0A450SK47_9GAMM|nr:MAG: hypothetical protein BECKFW1821B_GA0114236_101625 [Candidatus Kentron sp. FW]